MGRCRRRLGRQRVLPSACSVSPDGTADTAPLHLPRPLPKSPVARDTRPPPRSSSSSSSSSLLSARASMDAAALVTKVLQPLRRADGLRRLHGHGHGHGDHRWSKNSCFLFRRRRWRRWRRWRRPRRPLEARRRSRRATAYAAAFSRDGARCCATDGALVRVRLPVSVARRRGATGVGFWWRNRRA